MYEYIQWHIVKTLIILVIIQISVISYLSTIYYVSNLSNHLSIYVTNYSVAIKICVILSV